MRCDAKKYTFRMCERWRYKRKTNEILLRSTTHLSVMVCLNGRNNIYWHRKSSERRKRNRNGCGIPLFECVMCTMYIFALETYVLNDLAASLVVSVCRSLWYSTLLKQCVRTYENFVNLTISSEKREEKLLQSNTLAFQWARGVHLWLTTALFLRQISVTTTKKSTHTHENDGSIKLWIANTKHTNDKYFYCVIFTPRMVGCESVFLCANLSHIIMASEQIQCWIDDSNKIQT